MRGVAMAQQTPRTQSYRAVDGQWHLFAARNAKWADRIHPVPQTITRTKQGFELVFWQADVDLAFAKATKAYSPKPEGDTVVIATELLSKYAPLARKYARSDIQTKPYSWKLAQGVSDFSFDVGDSMAKAGTYQATFQWKSGDSALKIHSVALYEGDKKIAEDVHEGWTGNQNRQNIYRLEVLQLLDGLESYASRAQVSGASSTNSKGILKFIKINSVSNL